MCCPICTIFLQPRDHQTPACDEYLVTTIWESLVFRGVLSRTRHKAKDVRNQSLARPNVVGPKAWEALGLEVDSVSLSGRAIYFPGTAPVMGGYPALLPHGGKLLYQILTRMLFSCRGGGVLGRGGGLGYLGEEFTAFSPWFPT